jgi:hypothetical protein
LIYLEKFNETDFTSGVLEVISDATEDAAGALEWVIKNSKSIKLIKIL